MHRFLAISTAGMRLCAVLATLTSSCLVCHAQTPSELEARFGRPDRDGFNVAPNLRLSVAYGKDARACRLDLRAKPDAMTNSQHEQIGFKPEIADRVLNDIAPPALRIGTPRSMSEYMGCPAVASDEYRNVVIKRVMNDCKKTVEALIIEWICPACGNVRQ